MIEYKNMYVYYTSSCPVSQHITWIFSHTWDIPPSILPRAHARGVKQSVLSVVCRHNEIGEKLASNRIARLTSATNLELCWPRLSTTPT